MDDDDGLLALAPQWLKAGKTPGASGGTLQGGAGAPKQDTDTSRVTAAGTGRRGATAPFIRPKPEALQQSWRPEPLSSPGKPGSVSSDRLAVGSRSVLQLQPQPQPQPQPARTTESARGQPSRDRATSSRPRQHEEGAGRRQPAPIAAARRGQPSSARYNKEFDNTFPHLSGRHAAAGPPPPISTGQPASAQASAWHKPDVSPRSNGSSDSRWTSRLAQPASPAAPSTPLAANGVTRDAARPASLPPEPRTPRQQRALVPMPVAVSRPSERTASARPTTAAPVPPLQRSSASLRARSDAAALRPGSLGIAAELAVGREHAGTDTAASASSSTLTVLTRPSAPAAKAEGPREAGPGVAQASPTTASANGSKLGNAVLGKAKEGDRNSFFQSLRSKAQNLSSTLSSSTASGLSEQENASVPVSRQPSVEVADLSAGHANGDAKALPAVAQLPASLPLCYGNGTAVHKERTIPSTTTDEASCEAQLLAEEEAFLRSLGWNESDDDSQGGLTEEEIAAFQARLKASSFGLTSLEAPVAHSHLLSDLSQANGCFQPGCTVSNGMSIGMSDSDSD